MDIKIQSSTDIYRNPNTDAGNADMQHKRILVTNMGEALSAIQKGRINVDGDTLELSDEAKTAMQEAFDKAMAENAKINEMNAAMHNSVWAEQTADAEKKMMEDEAKALKIAMRIGKGDIVPQKDESFLMTTKPDLYKMAKMQALTAKEHKKQKTLMDDDEEQKEYDWDRGHDDTLHRVAVDIAIGNDGMSVEGVSEVAVSSNDIGTLE